VQTEIEYSATTGSNIDIWTAQPDGESPHRLTNHSNIDTSPAWSPDRSQIAFSSTRTGNGDIYVMRSDGTGVIRSTTDSGIDGEATWSPDGTRIAYTSGGVAERHRDVVFFCEGVAEDLLLHLAVWRHREVAA
jgi:Tol biopolymer transport system component